MSSVLGIDPSGARPGYAIRTDGVNTYAGVVPPFAPQRLDIAAVEGPWIGRMGKLQMWGLGFDAALRLAPFVGTVERCVIVTPNQWRRMFGWPSSLPKEVVVARLRQRLERSGAAPYASGWTDDMVEADGIAEAVSMMTPAQLGKLRRVTLDGLAPSKGRR